MSLQRRSFLTGLGAMPLLARPLAAAPLARVVILGAGFGGASLARFLRAAAPGVSVTLVDRQDARMTCPFSNGVIAGLWPAAEISFDLSALRAAGVTVITAEVTAVEPETRSLVLADGRRVTGDFMVLSPGISFDWQAIAGLTPETSLSMPHAWTAGPQTLALRDQLSALPEGGRVVIGIPRPPFRCPPGPYERISLIAHALKTRNPRAKILVLDGQDSFSKQRLFEQAWAALYPGMIERIPAADMGTVIGVDPKNHVVSTAFDDHKADVASIIPQQQAASLLREAGLDRDDKGTALGWCPVDALSFESRRADGVYILGDAALQGEMPKSAFAANVQAAACGRAILAKLGGSAPAPTVLLNVCYSLAAPDYGFSIADAYAPRDGRMALLAAEGRTTPIGETAQVYAAEAGYARSWYNSFTTALYG